MASNPYAPRTAAGNEVTLPTARLRRVGATDREVEEARAAWANLSREDQRLVVDAIAALTDDELAAQLMDDRDPYPETLLGVPDGAGAVPPDSPDPAPGLPQSDEGGSGGEQDYPDPAALVAGSVSDVLAKVGGDPVAARLAIVAETAGRQRRTLLRELRRIRDAG